MAAGRSRASQSRRSSGPHFRWTATKESTPPNASAMLQSERECKRRVHRAPSTRPARMPPARSASIAAAAIPPRMPSPRWQWLVSSLRFMSVPGPHGARIHRDPRRRDLSVGNPARAVGAPNELYAAAPTIFAATKSTRHSSVAPVLTPECHPPCWACEVASSTF